MSRTTMRAGSARATATQTAGKNVSSKGPTKAPARRNGGLHAGLNADELPSVRAKGLGPSATPVSAPIAKSPAKSPAAVKRSAASVHSAPKVQVTARLTAGRSAQQVPLSAAGASSGSGARVTLKSAGRSVGGGGAGSKSKSSASLAYHERLLEDLWQEYRVTPSQALRNFLIQKYLDLVRFTAERMHMKLPSEVEVDDLMSAGLFGLMDAIDAFDPDRGVKFETYCTQRIRGAIFDELRAMDWVPRLVRSRTAKMEKVRRAFEMEQGRRPTEHEISERMELDKPEFDKMQKDSRPTGVVSLNRKWFETDSSKEVREIDVIRDTKQEDPFRLIQRNDVKTLITKGLSRAERLIVVLYYYEEMTMKEIGTTLDLSESRVSQMHSSILARLKAQMQHRERDI